MNSEKFTNKRQQMVEDQIIARDIDDKKVIEAMLKIPRHNFVPRNYQNYSYTDNPVPIGYEQTISQPYIVALMTKLLDLEPGEKVLEVGTGSGYQTAILAELGCNVFTVEIIRELLVTAQKNLNSLGYQNIKYNLCSGYEGWEEFSPFDKIIVTAAPPKIPEKLINQLREGGKMVAPVGGNKQNLQLLSKVNDKIKIIDIGKVRFVPMKKEVKRGFFT